MTRKSHGIAICLLSLFLVGCSGPITPSKQWLDVHGGLVEGAGQIRAERSLARLGFAVRVHVVATGQLAAWSWSDGTVVVSQGLVEQLSDDEIAAAIAHELGHLVGNHHLFIEGLRGGSAHGNQDEEMHADAIGVELLMQRSISPSAMSEMLQKVADAEPANSPCRRALLRRIAALKAHTDSRNPGN